MSRIGVDVGGTNTDAVLIDGGEVLRSVKVPTSEDVTSGIFGSLAGVAEGGALQGQRIDAVMIGTTHFVNAVLQRRSLSKVAALRACLPASESLEPFCDWPSDLAEVVNGGVWMVEGGHEFDGRPFMPLDTDAVRRAAIEMRAKGLRAVAISATFSPLDNSHERQAAEIVAQEVPDAEITCSCDLGRIGVLERGKRGAAKRRTRRPVAGYDRCF